MTDSSELNAGSVASSVTNSPVNIAWYIPTPTKLLASLLLLQAVLFLSQHYQWFSFNKDKGVLVVITLATTSLFVLLIFGWLVLGRFFRSKAQFSLATLMLFVPVIAIPCAWFAQEYQQAKKQQKLVADAYSREIRLKSYSLRSPTGVLPSYVPSPVAKFLLSRLGYDFFGNVASVEVRNADDEKLEAVSRFTDLESLWVHGRVSDAGIGHLKALSRLKQLEIIGYAGTLTDAALADLRELPELEVLHLSSATIADAGLAHLTLFPKLKDVRFNVNALSDDGLATLAGIPSAAHLETLNLSNSKVTDRGLSHLKVFTEATRLNLEGNRSITDGGIAELAGLHQLLDLNLNSTSVSDVGLEKLANLRQLEQLDLQHTRVGDQGLAGISSLKRLKRLRLGRTAVTDAGLVNIVDLQSLASLDLHDTQVTDAGLEHVGRLKGLKCLILMNTHITDTGLDSLLELTQLDQLFVYGSRVTDEGRARFKKAMPPTSLNVTFF